MPELFVFPGGRVDYADRYAPFFQDYGQATYTELLKKTSVKYTALKARMTGLAAIREVYEEVGLFLAKNCKTSFKHKNGSWNAFTSRGLFPDLSKLIFIARAITPPKNVKRFDTRFFIMQVDDFLEEQEPQSSKELEEVQWLTFNQARNLPHHFITSEILNCAEKTWSKGALIQENIKIPFYRAQSGKISIAERKIYL